MNDFNPAQKALDLLNAVQSFVTASAERAEEPTAENFDRLATELIQFQNRHIPAYQRLCRSRGVPASGPVHWSETPVVPTRAFSELDLSLKLDPISDLNLDQQAVLFRSSGTTGGPGTRSEHRQLFPQLYRSVLRHSYPQFCLEGEPTLKAPPTLFLVPPSRQLSDSSLSFMASFVATEFAAPESAFLVGPNGVDTYGAEQWLRSQQEAGKPCLIFSTAFALADLLDFLKDRPRLSLAPGSRIFETGGFKGKRKELSPKQLREQCVHFLNVSESFIVREYGMTELTSQSYSTVLRGGDPDLFQTPPWLRVQILDPVKLTPVDRGQEGLLSFFDLANVGSVAHLVTADLGVQEPGGFRLLGRAPGAALRGCSLTLEELTHEEPNGKEKNSGPAQKPPTL